MRAAVFEGAGKPLVVRNVPDPEPAADEVVLKVAQAGICGSDLHVTEFDLVPAGTVLGHEFAGEIVALGRDVTGWKPGDVVTALPIHACGECDACQVHLPGLCTSGRFTGTTLENPGAYAEYVRARVPMLQRLPKGVSVADGAMVEPLSVSRHAVRLAGDLAGDTVVVMGAGPIGVGVALFARLQGARHVIVSEPAAGRRDLAQELGATHVVNPLDTDVAAFVEEVSGRRPDVVFECVGNPGLLQQAIDLAGVRGRVIVAGVCFSEDLIRPLSGLMKEVSIRFSQTYTEEDFADVIDAIASGRAEVSPMRTETIGFAELPDTFEALRKPGDQCKILIRPD